MTGLYDAIATARALVPAAAGLPAEAALGACRGIGDLPILRLWQAVESGLKDRPRRVVQLTACAAGEADPAVAVRLGRLAGRVMGGGVLVLNAVDSETRVEEGGRLAFGPLPGRGGDARALDSALLGRYWDRLSERAGLIILDTPPVLASPLALGLAPSADGVILLIEAERTREAVAAAARDALVRGGANLLGAVLTKRRFHVPKRLYEML
ncbi:hypothetical protein [Magnetospirillum sp. UT-4]|uniref:hypothetical protein n=1 Tax=Magnetospirillum sp. UT-4 TaxID=2681467 RepID=UPI0013830D25|nr:hypothetical protein [Magnetospirillum sp. UT-4]CAA7612726.1 hypothetical protein MTBUT4_120024 [Magnetospirillum sp. UT-4]